ncbi:hypothetical protein DFP74_6124 [Nocardiopsis sp. Huas11]|uniref:RICIN domain-containing protein n=1 Tax=Nocardiopsis sp. Huas11 TaxID=2183912 RepID=UPI000EADB04E|nr:ricin-type beta-trefoil lectin domain protein [Nocardiopsis sp. Huas11]RKS10361.1 hypothetical protein DFP74_6124 [Nocardiopsis sp. Huas11]
MKISVLAVSAAVAVGVLSAAPASAGAVPDDFRYLVHKSSGLCVANTDQGKPIELIECDEGLGWDDSYEGEPEVDHNQHWWFIPRDGHHVAVNHLASVQAEDFVVMTATHHKHRVITAPWEEKKKQKWTLIRQGHGWALKNAKSHKCLTFGGYAGDKGVQKKCDGGADQTFEMPFAHPAPPLELP